MAVRIDIGDDGRLRLSVDGIVLDLVDTVVVTSYAGSPARVSVAFFDMNKLGDQQLRVRYSAMLRHFEHLARQSSVIDIIGVPDTLQSVGSVRTPVDK